MGRLCQVSKAEAPPEILEVYRQFFGDRDPSLNQGPQLELLVVTGRRLLWFQTSSWIARNSLMGLLQPGRKLDPRL